MRRLLNVLYRLYALISTLRRRGLGWGAVSRTIAVEFASRAWRVLARPVNAMLLGAPSSAVRFRRFLSREVSGPGCFFVIAMPRTLHYLFPSLDLLPADLAVVIIGNGLRSWERRALARRYPDRARFDLPALPGTSQMHGRVLSLFLRCAEHDFGILDHDLYAPAIITAGFEVGWYAGGIYGAGMAAKEHNTQLYEKYCYKMLQQERLFPFLMLHYGF